MPVAKPLRLRLFLEGQEVPVISAQVSINVNAPATCSIQVLPLDEAMRLKPRTMVHVFFLERGVQKEKGRFSGISDEYKLLFSGEVVGFAFTQSPMSRAVVLQCVDFSSYWDACQATVLEYGPGGNALSDTAWAWGSNPGVFDNIVSQTAQQLTNWVKARPQTPGLTQVSGLAGGILHVMEQMSGIPGKSRGVNDFFTVAELRCRLLSQITAEQNDDGAQQLLDSRVFDQWINQGLQNIGIQVSFRDMMKLLFSYIYYECVPNPVAKFDPELPGNVTRELKKLVLSQTMQGLSAKQDLELLRDRLPSYVSRNDERIVEIEAEGLVQFFTKTADSLRLLLKTVRDGKQLSGVIMQLDLAKTTLEALLQAPKKDSAKFSQLESPLKEALRLLDDPQGSYEVEEEVHTDSVRQRLHTQIVRPDCFFAAPPVCNVVFPEHYTQLSYDRIYTNEVTRVVMQFFFSLSSSDDILDQRVLSPAVGQVAKHVLTAEDREEARMMMSHEYHTGIINRFEKLPDTAVGSNIHISSSRRDWAQDAALHHFFKYRYGGRALNVAGRFNPYLVCGFPGVVLTRPWIIRGVSERGLSQQLLQGLQDRAMEEGSGVPTQFIGMVEAISHSVSQDGGSTSFSMHHVREHAGVDDEYLRLLLQEKSKFTTRLAVPLRYDEVKNDPRLLSILTEVTPQGESQLLEAPVQMMKQTVSVDVPVSTVMSEVGRNGARPLKVGDTVMEPSEDFLLEQTDIVGTVAKFRKPVYIRIKPTQVQREVTVPTNTAMALPPYVALGRDPSVRGGQEVYVPFPSGTRTQGSQGVHGTLAFVEVVDSAIIQVEGRNVFSHVVLHEDLEIEGRSSEPVEEKLRPQWFSEAYANQNVGPKIYQPFFGCNSLVDDILVSGLGATLAAYAPVSGDTSETASAQVSTETLIERARVRADRRNHMSIERAVNLLSLMYGMVKAQVKDVDEYVRSFTYRPIATLTDILGDVDLDGALSFDGAKPVLGKVKRVNEKGETYETQPRVGFHSLSLSRKAIQAGNYTGLLADPSLAFPRVDNHASKQVLAPEYDVRHEKLKMVDRYRRALEGKRGLQG